MTAPSDRRWSSHLVFLAAAIGSAVGISNVWKFTYVAGENGGGAFVLVYVGAIALVALPALIAEFLVGRRGGASVVKSMENLTARDGIHPAWRYYGQMAALGAFIALSFYAVVAGWTVDYFFQAMRGGFDGISADGASAALDDLMASPGRMIVSQLIFLGLTAATVAAGIRGGLERVLRWLTPALFLILIILLMYAIFAGDFAAGARFLFVPDFSRLNAQTVLLAIGQAFFSLGIGLGVLFTIGAYMDRKSSIVRASIVVAAADGGVALLAGLAIFPIVFAHGLSPAEGPGLIFATLPVAFGQMPMGAVLGPLFFVLMAIAALTSAITILETVVATVEDYSGMTRHVIVAWLTSLLFIAGLGTVFSFSSLADFHPLGFLPAFESRTIFESLDYIVSNFMMPAGGVLIAMLAGWGLSRQATLEEMDVQSSRGFGIWRLLVRFLVPAAIAAVFVVNLNAQARPSNVEQLQRLSAQYVDARRPGASQADRTDYSAAAFVREIHDQQQTLEQLLAIDPQGLSLEQDIDLRLLIGIARSDINTAQKQRRWENDPALYIPSEELGALFEPEFPGSEAQRLEQLSSLLTALPARLEQGRRNLKRPPLRFTRAAIFQAQGSIKTLVEGRRSLAQLGGEQAAAYERATAALNDFLGFLQQDLLGRSDGDWALGREAYDFILQNRWHMDIDAEQILQRGLTAFEETEALAQGVASGMQPGKHWTEVYETLKDDHPAAQDIKQAYQQQMDAAQAFVREYSVVTLPAGERVITIDTPPAMRRSSPFGTFQAVSPFEGGLEGRLILTPIEQWMPPEQQAQRLRSHHTAWIPVIAVHEAYPGHHTQALIVNENPNLLRRVIQEPIFSEGWGLFTEELMFELGFLQGDDVRLTQLRNRLWRAARVILDVSLHTGRMGFDEAVAFLVEKVRFEPYAAELEVGMYIERPTYVLGYLIGMQEIASIRADYIALHGEPGPPSEFYDRLLRIGSIPPALLREELLGPKVGLQ